MEQTHTPPVIYGQPTPGAPQQAGIPEAPMPTLAAAPQGAAPAPAPAPAPTPAAAAPAPAPAAAAPDVPDGEDGADWQAIKADFHDKLARVGNPEVYMKMREAFAGLEKQKISDHLQAALMASSTGDNEEAARQLQAVGAYTNPGVKSSVQVGPGGSFIVQNKAPDGKSTGYAVTPDNLMDFAYMMQDLPGYAEFSFTREMEREKNDILWKRYEQEVKESNANITLREAQTAREGIEAQTSSFKLMFAAETHDAEVAAVKLGVAQDEANLVKTEQEIGDKEQGNKEQFQTSLIDLLLGSGREALEGAGEEEMNLGLLYSGQAAEAPENPALAANPFYMKDDAGNWVENTVTLSAASEFATALKAADPTVTPHDAALAIKMGMFDLRSQIEFRGNDAVDGPLPEASPDASGAIPAPAEVGWTGVLVNGQRFDLNSNDLARLEPIIMQGRAARAEAGEINAEMYKMENGRGYYSVEDSRRGSPLDNEGNAFSDGTSMDGEGPTRDVQSPYVNPNGEVEDANLGPADEYPLGAPDLFGLRLPIMNSEGRRKPYNDPLTADDDIPHEVYGEGPDSAPTQPDPLPRTATPQMGVPSMPQPGLVSPGGIPGAPTGNGLRAGRVGDDPSMSQQGAIGTANVQLARPAQSEDYRELAKATGNQESVVREVVEDMMALKSIGQLTPEYAAGVAQKLQPVLHRDQFLRLREELKRLVDGPSGPRPRM